MVVNVLFLFSYFNFCNFTSCTCVTSNLSFVNWVLVNFFCLTKFSLSVAVLNKEWLYIYAFVFVSWKLWYANIRYKVYRVSLFFTGIMLLTDLWKVTALNSHMTHTCTTTMFFLSKSILLLLLFATLLTSLLIFLSFMWAKVSPGSLDKAYYEANGNNSYTNDYWCMQLRNEVVALEVGALNPLFTAATHMA